MSQEVPEHVPERRYYPVELKKVVIHQRFTLKMRVHEIALNLAMPKRVVERVLQVWMETGEVHEDLRRKKGQKKKSVMEEEEKEVCTCFFGLSLFRDIYTFSFYLRFQKGHRTFTLMSFKINLCFNFMLLWVYLPFGTH
jgi:hypothetical protein